MTTMNKDLILCIDEALRYELDKRKNLYPPKLYEAMEYCVFSGGKRVRPYLMFLTADFVGVERETVKPLALSLELIHTYSLIHDDMPCMDDDDVRRGRPSCHKAFGEAIALLAGDALLNLAYEIALDAVEKQSELAYSAAFLAKLAGAEGMIGGQAMEFSYNTFDEETITELYMKKTGALIKAAALIPSFLSGDREKIAAIGTYAGALGLNFQLRDDLLDVKKDEEKSYLNIMGRNATEALSARLNETAKNALKKWGEAAKPLIDFSELLTNRKK